MIYSEEISRMRPYAKNAKKHPKKQIAQIAASIKEFGFNQPIVIDLNGVIIVGHGRYEAAKLLGLKDVPAVKVDITDEQAKSYRLADNRLNESEWDMDMVIAELRGMDDTMVELTGFSKDLLLESEDKDDEVPDLPEVPQTQLGDIYQVNGHRIMCGDATSHEDVGKLMNGAKADLVFSDPPYNVNYSGSGENSSTTILNDNMTDAGFDTLLTGAFQRFAESSKSGAGWYIFHSYRAQDTFKKAIEKTEWKVKSQLIWNKPSAGLGMNEYRPKHEPFFYCVNKQANFYGDRTGTTVWNFQKTDQQLLNWAKKQRQMELDGKTTVWTMKREPVQDYVHPTQKPVELITYAIINSSKEDDIVLDLFGGSGSTLIAAEKTGRKALIMELDPLFVDVIVKRYQEYTGEKAAKVE